MFWGFSLSGRRKGEAKRIPKILLILSDTKFIAYEALRQGRV